MLGHRLARLALGFATLLIATSGEARKSTQGPRLHGEARQGKNRDVVWFPKAGWRDTNGQPFDQVTVMKGTLVAYRRGVALPPNALLNASVTARATDGSRVTYRVSAMNPPPNIPGLPSVDSTNSTMYYTLVDPQRAPYCHPSSKIWVENRSYVVDADGGLQAVPVPEVWNRSGTEGSHDGYFTMACTAGAIAKCYRWGYQGWRQIDKAKAYVQACTRMAMADYCGDGQSHTMEGTPIYIYDFATPVPVNGAPTIGGTIPTSYPVEGLSYSFETAWVGGEERLPQLDDWGKAHCEPSGGALCLSKKRWDAIPLDGQHLANGARSLGTCPLLKDPRARPESTPAWHVSDCKKRKSKNCKPERPPRRYVPGEFCDYFANGEVDHRILRDAGALLFNGSPYLDPLLSMWTNRNGTERWTSIGQIDEGPQVNAPAPPPGYGRPAVPLGWVFSAATPPSVLQDLPKVVELYSYYHRETGDHLTTTGPPPADYGDQSPEGLIYPCVENASPPTASIPLYRYKLGNDQTTTTVPILPTSNGQCKQSMTDGRERITEGYLPIFMGH